jgi:protein arginine kinase activator
MICESCQKNEATVHLTQVIDGNVKKLHLCEHCARNSGFDIKGPMSITDVLLGLGAEPQSGVSDSAVISSKNCTGCALTLASFRRKGRLGCPECYESFETELIPLLDSMHHSTQHIGKMPGALPGPGGARSEVKALEQLLRDAVAGENYEEAAVLRDRIAAARGRGSEQE